MLTVEILLSVIKLSPRTLPHYRLLANLFPSFQFLPRLFLIVLTCREKYFIHRFIYFLITLFHWSSWISSSSLSGSSAAWSSCWMFSKLQVTHGSKRLNVGRALIHILFSQSFTYSDKITETWNLFVLFFSPQFLFRRRRICAYRRNGTTASGSAGTFPRHPPWATGSSTSLYLVIYTHTVQNLDESWQVWKSKSA